MHFRNRDTFVIANGKIQLSAAGANITGQDTALFSYSSPLLIWPNQQS